MTNGAAEVRAVAGACEHSVVLDIDGTVWLTGCRFATGLAEDTGTPQRAPLPAGTQVAQISSGYGLQLFLSSNGDVFSCGGGNVQDISSLGFSEEDAILGPNLDSNEWKGSWNGSMEWKPAYVRSLPLRISLPSRVVRISAGWHHSLAVTEAGEVFAWGGFGAVLGLGASRATVWRPEKVVGGGLSGEVVVDVSTGGDTTSGAVTRDGKLFTWGELHHGHGQAGSIDLPRRVLTFHRFHANRSLSELTEFVHPEISMISFGYSHCLALASGGDVYAWGENDLRHRNNHAHAGRAMRGKLGFSDVWSAGIHMYSVAPRRVEPLVGKEVVEVSTGNWHTLVRTKDGKVFACGANFAGQLGLGQDTEEMLAPCVISGLGDGVSYM
jgi:alpha-tubulin suppressor-like RCC1 family protein